MNQPIKKRSHTKRLARIVIKTILFLVLFFLLIVVLILTPPVQNFIRKKAVAYLENKLDTKVQVGRIYIGLPKKIILEDIYIEDRQKDTLLSAGSIKANLAILKLLFKNEIDISSVQLEDITAKIKRQLPDTDFNYQFIADAFTTSTSDTASAKSSSSIAIGSVTLNKARLLYKDVVTGNDIEAWIDHFDTKVDQFDPATINVDIPHLTVRGMVARVYQSKPLSMPSPPLSADSSLVIPAAAPPPQLIFGKITLEKIDVDYRNDVSALNTTANISSLVIEPEKIDFEEEIIDINSIFFENSIAAIRLGRKEAARELVKEIKETADSSMEKGWRMNVASFISANNNFQFDNDNFPRQSIGMDYAHLKAMPFVLEVKDFSMSEDSITGKIEKASFKEQSGFELQELTADFLYSENQSYLHDLYLKTPGTELKRSAAIRYASLEALKNDIANLQLDLDINNSKVLVKDILAFAPMLKSQPAFADAGATWYINSRITGRIADLKIDELQVQGLQDTKIDTRGTITGLPDMNRFNVNLVINNISSSRRDINRFIPAGMLPQNITLPSRFNVTGHARGNTNDLTTELSARTDLGNAVIKGNFKQVNDFEKVRYDAIVQTTSLNLGTLLQDQQNFGPATATFTVTGTGFNPTTADLNFNGTVHSIVLNQYNYRNLDLKGKLNNQQAEADLSIIDPNIHLNLHAVSTISSNNPTASFTAMIDSIKLQPLHLAPDPVIYRGKAEGNFTSMNPDDLVGKLYLTQSLLVQGSQRLQLDTVLLTAARTDSGHSIVLNSEIIAAKLQGQYRLTQLGVILEQAIQPYFAVNGNNTLPKEPYDFTLDASVLNSLPLKTFLPALERMDSLQLQSRFSNTIGWNATVRAPVIDYAGTRLRGLNLKAGTIGDSIQADLLIDQLNSGNMALYATSLKATMANNTINFITDTKDRAGQTKYRFSAVFRQPQRGQYSFSLAPGNLLLNYETWSIPANNQLVISKNNITASNFVLNKSGQQLSLNSISQSPDAPLEVRFTNFRLATITAFIQNDSTLVNGNMNGDIRFTNIINDPIFEGSLNVADLSVKNDTVGNVIIRVNNTTQNTYVANATLSGRGNNVQLDGKYFARGNGNSNFDLDLNIVSLPLTTAEAFSNGAIRSASGNVNGRFAVTGTLDKPSVRGDLNFDQAGFNLATLNSYFKIDKEKIEVNETGIRFNRFEIKDSLNNPLILNGTAATTNFMNYSFDFTIRADNFQALNSTKKDNNLFYGQLFFNSNLHVGGTEQAPIVDGRIRVNEKTKMTIVLPQREPGIVEREGVIEFVDMDAPLNDSLFMAAYDSLNTTALRGFDVTANIEVSKEAQFNLIIDEGNGDFLNVRGEASLSAGIDLSGKLTLAGSYELEEGSYELTFNFIRRKFDIEKGSKIIWLGEPTEADVDITAKYIANASPLDLVKNELGENVTASQRNTFLQKIPFDIMLYMKGKLLKPEITFDIMLPEDKNYGVDNQILTITRTKLDYLRLEPGELNKQVFAVLLLNRFIGENPFNSSSEFINPNALARQSVSKLLTEQLNRLAGDLIEGVDLNFDVIASEDYTTGERRDRTDLNVGISKKLLSDRLTVSVGSNFELEGPQNSSQRANNIAGNVALNYRVSSDGRYLLRAYRKNEYEGIIDGYIIETGVSFIITVDYNRFRQIFLSKEQRQKRRENRRAARKARRERAATVVPEEKQP
jgi:translocation and assembly module TamB